MARKPRVTEDSIPRHPNRLKASWWTPETLLAMLEALARHGIEVRWEDEVREFFSLHVPDEGGVDIDNATEAHTNEGWQIYDRYGREDPTACERRLLPPTSHPHPWVFEIIWCRPVFPGEVGPHTLLKSQSFPLLESPGLGATKEARHPDVLIENLEEKVANLEEKVANLQVEIVKLHARKANTHSHYTVDGDPIPWGHHINHDGDIVPD